MNFIQVAHVFKENPSGLGIAGILQVVPHEVVVKVKAVARKLTLPAFEPSHIFLHGTGHGQLVADIGGKLHLGVGVKITEGRCV